MRMRLRPQRGEKILHFPSGLTVQLLDVVEKDYVRVIFPLGKMEAVKKETLNLPIIDTQYYERITDV